MPVKDLTVVQDSVRVLDYQPGDGTRYYVVATKDQRVPHQWCVAFPDFGSSYWANELVQPMAPNYIASNWLVHGRMPNEATATKMAEAIALALPRRDDG